MRLFNLFNKQDDHSPAKEDWLKAKEHFDKGDFQNCLQTLAWGFKKDVNYLPLYQLAADSLGKLDGPDEQKLFEAVCKNPNDALAFHTLGNYYFSVEHYPLAQAFYEKTIQLDPKNTEAPHDLAVSYARRFQVGKAVEVLTKADSLDFWSFYFLNKCKLLDQKPAGVQKAITELMGILDKYPNQDEVVMPRWKVMELQETLQRLYSVEKIQTHIRDWQYIQYGGVVLDYFEDSDEYVAGGRYVAGWGQSESMKALAVKLKLFTEALQIAFQGVVSLPDRDSEIVGRLFAKELGLAFDSYDPAKTHANCLIVAADSSQFGAYEDLSTIQNGQVLLSVNHSWLASTFISPDIIGFMTQHYSFPWSGGGLRITDPGNGSVENVAPDSRSAEEIAAEIFALEQHPADFSKHLDFYAIQKHYLKGIGAHCGTRRYNFMVESPVPGSYFGS